MRLNRSPVLTMVLLLTGYCHGADRVDPEALSSPPVFDRYAIILERKPFGVETVPVIDPLKPVLSPEQSFTAKYKMAAVTRDRRTGVIQVGLVDLRSNRSYMLGIGDSLEGVEVIDADYVNEKARLRRDPEDYWVSMKGGSNVYEVVGREAPAGVAEPRAMPPPASRLAVPGKPIPGGRSSYSSRRQSREEARIRRELERMKIEEAQRSKTSGTNEPAVSVASVRSGKNKAQSNLGDIGQALLDKLGRSEDSDMTQEEINALLQEYQKELIRGGQAPLPIPLTPETDRALVEEGVLPAQP